ncbi:RLL domain containing protein [Trichuris trichiura]|uniref:RLL domain containing protein n=1 Tax=Trichuris trichiura TaxID=36087 RepID=A0A077Z031_TRITR|nr:RLL domain containing protein [Trichuris trichiura]
MFKRKLTVLQYPWQGKVNVEDDMEFRRLVSWLENQKICLYKTQNRRDLGDIASPNWDAVFQQYLVDLKCPQGVSENRAATIDWLLSHAVHLIYRDFKKDPAKILQLAKDMNSCVRANAESADNPLYHLNYSTPEFRGYVEKLADILGIVNHPNPAVTLKAVSILVQERLGKKSDVSKAEEKRSEEKVDLDSVHLGFDTKDIVLNKAGRILRLLHVRELRQLQTQINGAIVAIQGVTADPKTDQGLGKVGF